MPGKRKQTAPRKADEQKRQCLAWNMQDMFVNNSNTTDAGQTVAGPSSSHEPSQVTTEHRQTNSQSDGFLESLNTTDQSNGLHADQSLGSEVLDVAHGAKSVHFDEFSVVEIDIGSSPPAVESFMDGITDSSVGRATNGTVFADPVDGYDFFLTLFDSVDDAKWHCSLGTIVLNLFSIDGSGNLPKVLPPKASPVLYIFEHTEKHVLHLESLPDLEQIEGHTNDIADLEEDDQDIYVFATTAVGVSMLSGLAHMYKKKAARLVLRRYDPFQGTLELQLYLLEEALSRPQFASEGLTGKGVSRKLNRTLQELMEYFLGIPIPESYHVVHKKRQDVEGLYRHVREAHQGEDRSLTLDPQHHLLVPSLRPYQKEAVLWMLEMEQYGTDLQRESRAQADELHLLWREVRMPDGQTLFFNSYTGSLCKEKQSGLVPIPGGILADEMGLGKTVEALALMLLHPRPGFNRTTSTAGCTVQDKNRTTVGIPMSQDEKKIIGAKARTLQDENRTAYATAGTIQDENMTADAIAGTIQDENRTADATAGTIQDENRTTSAAGCTVQDKNRTTVGMLQDENKTSNATACALQDENKIADATAGTIQDENRTTSAAGCTVQDKNRTAVGMSQAENKTRDATTSSTLQNENKTADATACTLQDEKRTTGATASTLQDENKTADATAGTIQDENRTTSIAGCTVQDKNRRAVGMLQDENKGTGATAITLQDENSTADVTVGSLQDENRTADATITTGTMQDENRTADATAATLQDKNRIAAAYTTQGENKTSSATAITFQDKNSMSPDIKKSEVQCSGQDDVTVTFSKDTNCCKTHVESCKMDTTAGKSNAHPGLNRSSTENSNNVLLKVKEEEASAMEVANRVSEKTDSENTAAGIQQTSTHNSSNGPAILQPNGPDGKESVCKMTGLTLSGSEISERTLVCEGTSVQGSVEEKGRAKEALHAATVSGTVSAACVVSMECPGEITCTTQDTVDSHTTASHAQEQPSRASQEVQAQQPSTSSTDAQRQKRQKKSSRKTATKEKSKKSKKGATVVEPVYIPAPESCNVQSTNRFECICGVTDAHVDGRTRLQCWRCGNWQHATCVNYDATSEPTEMAEPYHCPHCSVSLPAVPSGATLIISPAPISHQWVDEINRHVRKSAINMLVYSGVKKQGFLQPKVLADHDIVITTYDVLRLELNYVDIPHSNSAEGRRFRHQKRYMAVPSPLPSVEWWRVCLDEAQMVECTTAKAAEMALRLSAVNRWCVTGTPIQRNLEDMYGLLLFLGVDPYWVKHWWERLLYQPYCHGNPRPMYDVIAKVMWRTAKKDVLDQINLPQQSEEVHWLKFSPVEEHFYRRKHEDCSRHAFKVLSQWHDLDTKLCQLDRRTMQTMLWPLLKLRQACCHPQAVRGEFLPLHKSTMTMDELLKSLTQKCKIECEEAHRQLICALNGLAGIHIIKEEYPEAVEKYREVLRSVQEHEGRLKTDKLQRLHTLHNLAGMLQRKLPGVAPTLRDDQLLKQAEELKMYYMQKSLDKIHTSQQTLLPIQQKVQQLRRKLQPGTPWWMDALQSAIYWGKDEDLAERIRNELSGDRDPDATSIVNKFRDLRGLQFLLTSQLENLQQSHAAVCTAVNHLSQEPTQQIIQSAVECHLRPEKGEELHTCEFCKADDLFLEYESRLFSFTAKRLEDMVAEEEENPERQVTRRGVWAQSETEKCLKIVLSFCKSSRLEEQWVEEGNMQVELFEQLRREYKQLHVVWMALRDRIASMDELDMATTRLRLRLPQEERTDPPQPNIIEPGEVDHQWIKNLNDKAVATSLLHRKLGQLLYLKNLAKSQEYQKDGVNPEPCPICQKELGSEWSVLMCGHCFCEECISVLVNQFGLGGRRGSIRCAICRQLTATRDISYVSTEAKVQDDVDVKGSHSTKVEAVVRTLKLIRQSDPTAKSLVFSTWQDVLDVVATALRENSMEYRAINGIHRFQENLTDFKYDSRIGVLLLPLHTGSHGLNIIEATHVLLVEPIINPAQEAQAIGRVHRIGQTKATIVHRFLVQNTIEERIHAMKKHISASDSIDTQSEGTVLTVGDLRDLFSDAFHHREDDTPPPPQQEYDQNNGVLEEFDDGDHHHGDGAATP